MDENSIPATQPELGRNGLQIYDTQYQPKAGADAQTVKLQLFRANTWTGRFSDQWRTSSLDYSV